MYKLASLAILIAFTGSAAHAQSQADIAAQLNEEGKELMYADKFVEAAKKFAEAVARVPEPKYFVNLCAAQLQVGKLNEALTACSAVELNNPTPDQKTRANKLLTKIKEEAQKQNVELHYTGGCSPPGPCEPDPLNNPNPVGQKPSDPNGPTGPAGPGTPPPGNRPVYGRPLGQSLVAAGPPEHRYTWTLGVDFFAGAGQIGKADYYGTAFGGVRVKGDYLFDPVRRIGGEVYLQYSQLGAGQDEMAVDSLAIFDIGVAAYKHWCPGGTPRLCFTPLAGVHLSLMGPQSEQTIENEQVFDYAGVGARFDLSMEIAFGRRYEHVLGIMVGANVYSEILSGPSTFDIEAAGLNTGGGAGYLGLGYTYRFNTPLGSAPFVILE